MPNETTKPQEECAECPECEGITGTRDCPLCAGNGFTPGREEALERAVALLSELQGAGFMPEEYEAEALTILNALKEAA